LLHRAGIPVLYMLGDLWVIYERPGPPLTWRAWPALDHFAPYTAMRRLAGRVAGVGRVDLTPPPIERDGIVCFVSAWLRDRYAELGFRPRHAHIVPNGIRVADFAGPRAAPNGELSALFAGRLDPGKGADLAVGAVAHVPGVRLTLVGDGEPANERAVRAQAAPLADRVRFEPPVPRERLATMMRASDVLVMPARYPDSFGLVYLEAMAAGAVVVGTAKGGAAELCHDGVNALVVSDESPAQMAAALERLRDDAALRERLRAAGAETARRYELATMVDRVEALL
jgi:glycosyltransferase involved in cell wall biosynthesis